MGQGAFVGTWNILTNSASGAYLSSECNHYKKGDIDGYYSNVWNLTSTVATRHNSRELILSIMSTDFRKYLNGSQTYTTVYTEEDLANKNRYVGWTYDKNGFLPEQGNIVMNTGDPYQYKMKFQKDIEFNINTNTSGEHPNATRFFFFGEKIAGKKSGGQNYGQALYYGPDWDNGFGVHYINYTNLTDTDEALKENPREDKNIFDKGYYVAGIWHPVSDPDAEYLLYHDRQVMFRLEWESGSIIGPITRLTTFPFFVLGEIIHDYRGVPGSGQFQNHVSTAMPTTTTTRRLLGNSDGIPLTIKCTGFDGNVKDIILDITFEERASHMNYSGSGTEVGGEEWNKLKLIDGGELKADTSRHIWIRNWQVQ